MNLVKHFTNTHFSVDKSYIPIAMQATDNARCRPCVCERVCVCVSRADRRTNEASESSAVFLHSAAMLTITIQRISRINDDDHLYYLV